MKLNKQIILIQNLYITYFLSGNDSLFYPISYFYNLFPDYSKATIRKTLINLSCQDYLDKIIEDDISKYKLMQKQEDINHFVPLSLPHRNTDGLLRLIVVGSFPKLAGKKKDLLDFLTKYSFIKYRRSVYISFFPESRKIFSLVKEMGLSDDIIYLETEDINGVGIKSLAEEIYKPSSLKALYQDFVKLSEPFAEAISSQKKRADDSLIISIWPKIRNFYCRILSWGEIPEDLLDFGSLKSQAEKNFRIIFKAVVSQ